MRTSNVVLIVLVFGLFNVVPIQPAFPLGTGFTYQGQLQDNGAPDPGPVNLRFSLWDAEIDGVQIGVSELITNIPVTQGLFVVQLNKGNQFSVNAFNGENRWLQIEDCPDGACDAPEVFEPRQRMTGVPYAHFATSAPWTGVTDIPEGFADNVDNSGDSLWGNNASDIFYNAGKVGIGSATPHHQLKIAGGPAWTSNGWAGALELDNGAAIGWQANDTGQRFGIGHSFGGLYFFNTDSDPGAMTSPADYAMTITDTGSVGIGTTSPDTKLHVADGRIRVKDTATGNRWDMFQANGGTDFFIEQNAAYRNFMIVGGPDGRVGIGTDTPAGGTKLNVVLNTAGHAILGDAPNGNGVVGTNASPGNGATAGINSAQDGVGVFGQANLGSSSIGVWGSSQSGLGALGSSNINVGVKGTSNSNIGVQGVSASSTGVEGRSDSSEGVYGNSAAGNGVYGRSDSTDPADAGVIADGGGGGAYGLRVLGDSNLQFLEASTIFALSLTVGGVARFNDNIIVDGDIIGGKSTLMIDHPLDPENKVLSHSSVESPDMMNIYNGNVITDGAGYAEIVLPDYFEALNIDFRYQLTVIGDFAQAVVSKEIANNSFAIQTDKPNVKVSWQVTGVRQDAWAKAHPTVVEEEKAEADRGKYLNPEVHGQPKEMGIHFRPEMEASSRTDSKGE